MQTKLCKDYIIHNFKPRELSETPRNTEGSMTSACVYQDNTEWATKPAGEPKSNKSTKVQTAKLSNKNDDVAIEPCSINVKIDNQNDNGE